MLCWADRLAVIWAGLVFAMLIWLGSDPHAGKIDYAQAILVLILPVWIFLRGLDWLFSGPQRRRINGAAHRG